MFEKLTDKLRRLFGASGKQPAATPAPAKKDRHKKQAHAQAHSAMRCFYDPFFPQPGMPLSLKRRRASALRLIT